MIDRLTAAYDYCQALTKREAKNFYYGFILLPPDQRRAIYSAYAFARECDDIADGGLDLETATAEMAARRTALDRCAEGDAEGPVLEALGETIRRYGVPVEYFHSLIDGVEMDLWKHTYATFDELREYCYRVASSVGLVCIEIFGYRGGEHARRCAEDLGIALQLTNILRDLQEDSDRGRVYLPSDELETFGYTPEELRRSQDTRAFRRLMAFQASRAREHYRRGRELLDYLPRRARACVGAMAGIYAAILDDIERDPGVVFRRRVSPGTGQKLALAGMELVRSLAP